MEHTRGEKNSRKISPQRLRKAVLLCALVLLSFQLIMGVLAAGSRNGMNKTALDADAPNTKWVGISEGINQDITLTHSFNGISLRIRNKGLSVNNIHLRVVNKETGEELFSKTVNSMLIASNEYTFFAEDTLVDIPETTTVELQINGGNHTLIEVNDSAEDGSYVIGGNPAEGSVIYGIISDYHSMDMRLYLLIAAILLAAIGAAFLILSWNHLKRATSFFAGYFIAATVIFLTMAAFSGRTDYYYYQIGPSEDETTELNDSCTADIYAVIPEYPIRGIVLNGFAVNNPGPGEGKLHVNVYDAATGEILQETESSLSNFSEGNSNYYVSFDDTYNIGTLLNIHIYTEGVRDNSVTLSLSYETYSEQDSLYINGELSDKHICGSYYMGWPVNEIGKSTIALYLAAIILGIILLLLHKKYRLPIRVAQPPTPEMQFADVQSGRKISYTVIPVLIIIAIAIVYSEYIYTYSVGKCCDKNSVSEEIAASEDLTWVSAVGAENAITEEFTAGDDDLNGIGLILGYQDHWEDVHSLKDKAAGQQITVQLYDAENDDLLEEQTYSMEDVLTQGKAVFREMDSGIDPGTLERYAFLIFPETIEQSQGKTFRLVISTPENNDLRIGLINEAAGHNMPLLILYHNYAWIVNFFTAVIAITVLLICLISIFMRHTKLEIWQVFFISMVTLGVVYSFIIPPYCVPDEKIHINTVYQFSNRICGMYGMTGPETMLQGSQDINTFVGNTMKVTASRYGDLFFNLFRPAARDNYVLEYVQSALQNVSALNYIPSVIGFTIARAFNVSMVTMVMAARWCNLIVVALIMSFGVRKMPFGKMTMVAVGLLPIMLQQVASCSYDGILLAAVYLFIGYVFAIEEENALSVCRILLLTGAAYLLVTEKGGVYLPVLGLLLLLPGIRNNKKIKRFIPVVCVLLIVAVGIKYSYLVKNFLSGIQSAQDISTVSDPNAIVTPGYILSRPIELLHLVENTVTQYGDELLSEIGGNELGDMTLYVPDYITFGFLVCIALASLRISGEKIRFTGKKAAYIALLCVMGILLITFAMLFTYTRIHSSYINGIQGRYLLPYIILLALLLKREKFVNVGRTNNQFVFFMIFLQLFVVGHVFLSVFI